MTATPDRSATAAPVSTLYRAASRAAWTGLAVNSALAVTKLVAGIAGHSIALIADAVNSIGDGFSSVVILHGLGVAQKPPDEEHPYGHSRAEAIAALSVAVLIGASAIGLAVEALRNVGNVHPLPPLWTLWIAGGNVVIKEGLYHYKRGVAKRTGSQALAVGAWDHRSDALSSLAVLVGLLGVRFGGEPLLWFDEAAAVVVAAFILGTSVLLYRSNASRLMDAQMDGDIVGRIESIAAATPGVVAVEQVRARRSGIEVFVDIHVEVAPAMTVAEGHEIAREVRRRLVEGLTVITDALVHVEPAEEE